MISAHYDSSFILTQYTIFSPYNETAIFNKVYQETCLIQRLMIAIRKYLVKYNNFRKYFA
nr:MAG TPA: hypothetical protein [Caudoviricetes sp.]